MGLFLRSFKLGSFLVCNNINKFCTYTNSSRVKGMDLCNVVKTLEEFAPLKLSESWDNVGLLVQPSAPLQVKTILLTNDLTEDVMDESIQKEANLIVSYHPPIFKALKHLTNKHWKERLVIKAIEHRIAVYSPHTAWDAMQNGVNDWLASGLGKMKSVIPVTLSTHKISNKLVNVKVSLESASSLLADLGTSFGNIQYTELQACSEIQVRCSNENITDALEIFHKHSVAPKEIIIIESSPVPILNSGTGRMCSLDKSAPLEKMIDRIKKHLSLKHVRLAVGRGCSLTSEIKTIALGAGSGASILLGVNADLYVSGEMSHHDVLDAVSNGISVVLCEHSNTERGYLNRFKEILGKELGNQDVQIIVSSTDRDPLETY